MRNPLIRRLPKQLKSELGKYTIIFLFVAATIALVSGWNVAGNSMSEAYDKSFEKYNIEDGNFELYTKADDNLLSALKTDNTEIYENFYIEQETDEIDSTIRIFKKRDKIDLECIMEGGFPDVENEIAIDRMYADNNNLTVGKKLSIDGRTYNISGLVALSDYSALYSDNSDMMFDAKKFGVAIVSEKGFEEFDENKLHYRYSWKYTERPGDDIKAKELSEKFLERLLEKSAENMNAVTGFIPEYINQAIIFAGNDINNDKVFINVFLYIVIAVIAFVFAIITSNTITKEAAVIGTLRATGYTKRELIIHYMSLPMIVIFAASVTGNILGYTLFKKFAADMYYNSYSLPTYVTLWNGKAFVNTTVIPLVIMAIINFLMLSNKLSYSPLRFLRRDIGRKKKKKAFRLNTKIPIMQRFRIRVIFQNMPNYITVFVGVFFANALLLFGFLFTPMLDKYQEDVTENLLAAHQYVMKTPEETAEASAEKYAASTLKTLEGKLQSEEISVYGIENNSRYIDISLGSGVYISNAYAEKHDIEAGDEITLREQFGNDEYKFKVDGVYYYPAALTVFMDKQDFNKIFGNEPDYFNGYFAENQITDIDETLIATEITKDDLTKTSRQLKLSMGNLMDLFLVFGIGMFMMIVYLLSKIIIEKNAQSVSMAKILGYSSKEINRIYVMTTSIVVIASLLITIPVSNIVMGSICDIAFKRFSGWLPYYIHPVVFVKMAVLGIVSYLIIAFILNGKVKKIPMSDALKNVE